MKQEKLKNWLIGAGVLLFIGFSIYYTFIRTTNEIGWLGADKVGRQVLIQTLDESAKSSGIRVTSDFNSHPIWERMIVGEPMRTVIRYEVQSSEGSNRFGLQEHLELPHESITDQFQGKVTLQDDYEPTKDELVESLKKHDAKTMEDFYAGFGFKRIELYTNGQFTAALEIKGTKNILHAGGD